MKSNTHTHNSKKYKIKIELNCTQNSNQFIFLYKSLGNKEVFFLDHLGTNNKQHSQLIL